MADDRLEKLSGEQIEFLVGMCQDVYGPTPFDLEVQFYLDQLEKEKDES